jgi:hypothetical protein
MTVFREIHHEQLKPLLLFHKFRRVFDAEEIHRLIDILSGFKAHVSAFTVIGRRVRRGRCKLFCGGPFFRLKVFNQIDQAPLLSCTTFPARS